MSSDVKNLWEGHDAQLSRPEDFTLDFIEPSAEFAPLITTFFKFQCDSEVIRDVQPANTGHLMIFIKGRGQARFYDGGVFDSQPVTLIGPTHAAMPYVVRGPFLCFGCGFTPLGWRAITGLSAVQSSDCFVDITKAISPNLTQLHGAMLKLIQSSEAQDELMARSIEKAFLPFVKTISERHKQLIGAVSNWLDQSLTPDVEELYAQLPIEKRQAQRIIKTYFGCAPKLLMRKYRAVRAAMILSDPSCTDEQAQMVLDLFYDQPHMTREIRHFAGRTPARIASAEGGLLNMWLDKENIRELRSV